MTRKSQDILTPNTGAEPLKNGAVASELEVGFCAGSGVQTRNTCRCRLRFIEERGALRVTFVLAASRFVPRRCHQLAPQSPCLQSNNKMSGIRYAQLFVGCQLHIAPISSKRVLGPSQGLPQRKVPHWVSSTHYPAAGEHTESLKPVLKFFYFHGLNRLEISFPSFLLPVTKDKESYF